MGSAAIRAGAATCSRSRLGVSAEAGGAARDGASRRPPSPAICCSIASILALTPVSPRLSTSCSVALTSESAALDEPPSAASFSGDSPSRRSRRKVSNSRLRTKSLRRLRSTMALSSERSSCDAALWGVAAQSAVGLATKRATLRKKPGADLASAMSVMSVDRPEASRRPACAQSPNIFCFISRRCCASSDRVAVGRASKRPSPIGSPVSSQKP